MQPTATVLVYSDDSNTREQVRLATGRRPAPDVPVVEFLECATPAAVVKELDRGGIDVCVLDGEAVPMGGMGLCRQIKDEVFDCPPVLLLIGRPQDAWLATWSRAESCGDPAGGAGGVRCRPGLFAAGEEGSERLGARGDCRSAGAVVCGLSRPRGGAAYGHSPAPLRDDAPEGV